MSCVSVSTASFSVGYSIPADSPPVVTMHSRGAGRRFSFSASIAPPLSRNMPVRMFARLESPASTRTPQPASR